MHCVRPLSPEQAGKEDLTIKKKTAPHGIKEAVFVGVIIKCTDFYLWL